MKSEKGAGSGIRLDTLEFSNHKGISWSGSAYRPFAEAKEAM